MDEVAFQNSERGCVTEKEPMHLPLGCSIRNLVKVIYFSLYPPSLLPQVASLFVRLGADGVKLVSTV